RRRGARGDGPAGLGALDPDPRCDEDLRRRDRRAGAGRRVPGPYGRRGRARTRARRGRGLGAERGAGPGGAGRAPHGRRASARGARGGRAVLRPRRASRVRRGQLMATPPELAHIHHAELLTTRLDESLRFFVDVLGMEVESQEGGSAYLRGWGDYARYSLKLS